MLTFKNKVSEKKAKNILAITNTSIGCETFLNKFTSLYDE